MRKTEDELNKMMEEAIKQAIKEHEKADSSLPLSERDKEMRGEGTPESEYLKIENETKIPKGYNGMLGNAPKEHEPEKLSPAPAQGGLFSGGLSGLLKSNDLILYALAFLLFNEKADDDLLLAVIYIMMGK